jgi:hypothetical protein
MSQMGQEPGSVESLYGVSSTPRTRTIVLHRSELTLSANSRLMHRSKTPVSFDYLWAPRTSRQSGTCQ